MNAIDITSYCFLQSRPPSEQTNFRCRLSLSVAFAKQLINTFDITPQFCGALLGEPDYGAPGNFANFDDQGNIEKIGTFVLAFSLHSRWHD